MITANERRGLIGLAVVLAVAVILVISTRRCGGDAPLPPEVAVSDSVSNVSAVQTQDSSFIKTDTISTKKRNKRKSNQPKKGASPAERNPLDTSEIVSH